LEKAASTPRLKTILCYGDSNTWGYTAPDGARLPRDERWTGLLQHLLGPSYYVIEEGLNGRTTAWDEPFRRGRNGLKMLMPILDTHAPIDMIVLMLGTNDLKHHYNVSAQESSRGLATLIQVIRKSQAGPLGQHPPILVVAPPRFRTLSPAMNVHFEGSLEKSANLPACYRDVCDQSGCAFFDSNAVVTVGEDGIHLDAAGHRKLGEALAPLLRRQMEMA
jgi:lysophospholipase L1-like esterase